MSTAKHTPGPWRSNGRFVGNMNHMSCVAECLDNCGNWSDDDLSRANARLISAAPTMLAALHDALEYFEDRQDTDDGPDGEPSLNVEARMAIDLRAAIARATGATT